MKNKRLGKFRFCDYCISWISIALLLFFSVASIVLELPLFVVILPSVYAIIWLGSIILPHCEQFSLSEDSITVFWGRKTKRIPLHSELTLIVSYADVCPPLTIRTAVGNQTHILKDKIAVSILQKIPLETALVRLHQNYTRKYTTSTVEACFEEYIYVYSFVCNQEMLDKLLANRNCQIIIPETLLKQISINLHQINVHIDTGY